MDVCPSTTEPTPDLVLRLFVGEQQDDWFPTFLQRLSDGLGRVDLGVETRVGGGLTESGAGFGSVTRVDAENGLDLEFRPVTWTSSPKAILRIRRDRQPSGSEVTLELLGWRRVVGAAGGEFPEWVAAALLPAILREFSPRGVGEWAMDQQAGRPAGVAAIETYRDPTYHWPSFLLILDRLQLTREDRLLEVGCGGGAFLRKALESECSSTGVDHSPEMVRLAREQNRAAIEAGRLAIGEGDAGDLPVADGAFTTCVCAIAFPFFPNPKRALREMYRALAGGGRLAMFMATAAMRGTPAALEPFASRGRFYEPKELADLVREAGFSDVQVEEPNLAPFAKAAGLPDEVVKVFDGTGGGMLLLAKKPGAPTVA